MLKEDQKQAIRNLSKATSEALELGVLNYHNDYAPNIRDAIAKLEYRWIKEVTGLDGADSSIREYCLLNRTRYGDNCWYIIDYLCSVLYKDHLTIEEIDKELIRRADIFKLSQDPHYKVKSAIVTAVLSQNEAESNCSRDKALRIAEIAIELINKEK